MKERYLTIRNVHHASRKVQDLGGLLRGVQGYEYLANLWAAPYHTDRYMGQTPDELVGNAPPDKVF